MFRSHVRRNGSASGEPRIDARREIAVTVLALAATIATSVVAAFELAESLSRALAAGDRVAAVGLSVLLPITCFLVFGSVVYQLTRFGWVLRVARHRSVSTEVLDALYDGDAPALTVLVPSYKEDARVVLLTLLSAALQLYPRKRVVLLVDDPPRPDSPEDRELLRAARTLPRQVRNRLLEPARRLAAALAAFEARATGGPLDLAREKARLGAAYRHAAAWCERQIEAARPRTHAEAFFVELVLRPLCRDHRARARLVEGRASAPTEAELRRQYRRLAATFAVDIETFERKSWVNLSHEPNKAMNLNAYLSLIGRALRERVGPGGRHLEDAPAGETADLLVPDADYVVTVDADSLLAPDYAARLVEVMERPGNERVAIAQTPYSAFPGAPGVLERVAGATTDIQRIIHQGFTAFGATFWVGANALLRRAALRDIAVRGEERGHEVVRFIQDRTVIEDTESTLDLALRGWKLLNYPGRLAYSATPPDFGALVIQRRRWANGGLIIVPKLLAYVLRGRASLAEALMRFHYLFSITAVNVGLLLVLAVPLTGSVRAAWLPLTAVPYYGLYLRDLVLLGYRAGDLLRVYALNLLLIPVNLSGVARSLRQAWTKERIPFARTPKVEGRTLPSAGFVIAEYGLLFHWFTAALVDFVARRFTHGAFAIVNAGFLLYAIGAFVGFRESRDAFSEAPRAAQASVAAIEPEPELAPALTPVRER